MFSQRNDFNRPRVLDRMKIAEINPLLSCLFTIDESPPTRVLAYEHPDPPGAYTPSTVPTPTHRETVFGIRPCR